MNTRTKSGAIVLGTLVAGVLVGALGTSFVINERADRIRKLRTPSGYVQQLEEVIQTFDEEQRDQVRAILEASHSELSKMRRDWIGEMRAHQESTRAQLATVLDAEQRERLEKFFERGRRRSGSRHDGRRKSRRPDDTTPPR